MIRSSDIVDLLSQMALCCERLASGGCSLQQLEAGPRSPARDEARLQSERCILAARPRVSNKTLTLWLCRKRIPTNKAVNKYLLGGKSVQYVWTDTRAHSESHARVTV